MKTTKTILAGALALSVASLAQSQTIVRLTGSTAFRAAVITAIEHQMPDWQGAYYNGDGSSSITGANISILSGTMTNVGSVIIKCSWAGSVGGVITLVQNQNISTWMANSTSMGNPAVAVASPTYDAAQTADFAMSDGFQSSTIFKTPVLHDTIVGVVPFEWVVGPGAPAGVSNATPDLVQALLTGGMPLSQWTGNPADSGMAVYGMGRNADSGTRLTAFADSGFGINTAPQQYQPTISGGQITDLSLWPSENVLGIFYSQGTSGYASGGTLARDMNNPTSSTMNAPYGPGYIVAYLGLNDAAKVTNGRVLTWNGFPYSETAVEQGSYEFWGYEHLLYRSSLVAPQKTVADQIAKQVHNTDAVVSGILVTAMQVGRATDGGLITYGNPY